MLLIWANLYPQITNVIDACEDDRLERRRDIAREVIFAQLTKEVEKYLVIRCLIDLIDNENNGPRCLCAGSRKFDEEVCKAIAHPQRLKCLLCTDQRIKVPSKGLRKYGLVRKDRAAVLLEACSNDKVVRAQPSRERLQHGRLAILTRTVDREVVSALDHLTGGIQAMGDIDHEMPLRIACARNVESPLHVCTSRCLRPF